ncbi:hypothetical protein J2S70_000322 [Trueperella bonasi]|uniref:Uncharacterized protein n=1 Tax=Trueperella bonasi TaxID=312286 RepID=A0ABT9NEV7_9ACTO|nr:hypothetical protein [Trueperella bonasi]MDP9805740.1 hypothetical protein [Trueperella bonasi]
MTAPHGMRVIGESAGWQLAAVPSAVMRCPLVSAVVAVVTPMSAGMPHSRVTIST